MTPRNKRKKSLHHFTGRLVERWNIHITRREIRRLVAGVERGECLNLGAPRGSYVEKMVTIRGQSIPVVYDERRKAFITARPRDPRVLSTQG